MSIFTQYKERSHALMSCGMGYEAGPAFFQALQVIVEIGTKGEELEASIRELEAENAELKRQLAAMGRG